MKLSQIVRESAYHIISYHTLLILLTRWKTAEALYLGQAITPTSFRRRRHIAVRLNFLFGFRVFLYVRVDMTEI